ncbi:molecular chaperone [Sphingomonas sp. GCM10030256]|uniref:molecular chaperone n=1 Tax=Sphingomonas sp. GCM10030256 TaxID=3273427 RepID=UPI00360FF583
MGAIEAMTTFRRAAAAASLATLLFIPAPAVAGVGDLLVAPTRVVLNGSRGTEIILNNIGDDVATYRISVELRRMKADGSLEEVTAPNAQESAARDMILYAPRRVTLPPKQPQAIRLSARAPQGLADGEYRVHLLFRAVPPPRPAVKADKEFKGIGFALTPIYGVTIPVIVRLGNLQATAAITDVKLDKANGTPAISLGLQRSGARSTFGEVRVLKAGMTEPLAIQRGIAVYTELGARKVSIPLSKEAAAQASGPVTVQYVEVADGVSSTIAETQAVLR